MAMRLNSSGYSDCGWWPQLLRPQNWDIHRVAAQPGVCLVLRLALLQILVEDVGCHAGIQIEVTPTQHLAQILRAWLVIGEAAERVGLHLGRDTTAGVARAHEAPDPLRVLA